MNNGKITNVNDSTATKDKKKKHTAKGSKINIAGTISSLSSLDKPKVHALDTTKSSITKSSLHHWYTKEVTTLLYNYDF